jgi:hypothetical protein
MQGEKGLLVLPCRGMHASQRTSERGTHSNSIELSYWEHKHSVINTKKKMLGLLLWSAGGGARMHASTTDLCSNSFLGSVGHQAIDQRHSAYSLYLFRYHAYNARGQILVLGFIRAALAS